MPTLMRHTLFWKYAAYFAGLVSALLVVSGAVGGYFAYRQSVAALADVQRTKAQFAAAGIDNFMRRVQETLHAAVDKFNTSDPIAAQDLRIELVALLRHHPEISELHWVDGDGIERMAVSRYGTSAPDAGPRWNEDPRFRGAHEASDHVGPVYFRKQTEPYVSVAAARDPHGAVLVAEVDLKHVWDVVSQVWHSRDGVAYVVDRDGNLISHPDIELVLRKTNLSALPQVRHALDRPPADAVVIDQAQDTKGERVVSTATAIARLGWTVFAEQPLNEAFRPVYASVARSVGLVLLGIVAAVAASVLLARRMVRPIREIESRARELAEGQFDRPIALRTGDELEALANQFDRMAARLRETYAMQETRIGERTRDLALANDAKTRFLAAASHDLRQPIHALGLFVGQLRGARSADESGALLEKIERSVAALNELLGALLDLSKLDVGSVTAQSKPIALHEILSRLTAEFAPSAEAKGLALTLVPTSLWIHSDPLLLERILLNAISNALRYTLHGRILVGCRRRGDNVEVLVADTGVGIEPTHLPNVFQEFYRADPLPGEMGIGLGLGLAIVKRLATLLDHRVTIQSTPGKGTVLRILAPRAPAGKSAPFPEHALTDSLQGVRVLIVDDEAPAREAMQGLLAQWGCDVVAVGDGDGALEHARTRRPDVVLCDLRLGEGETGVQVIERIERECIGAIACGIVTGDSAPEHLAEARASGHPIAFKPMAPGKLRAMMEHLVSRAAAAATK